MDKAITANRAVHIENHAREYLLNVQQIKDIYPNNYFEIDCAAGSREDILEDIARLLKFKINAQRPKRPAAILILGGKREHRVAIAKKLARRYGFVLAMAREQLNEQISKNSEVGRLVLDNIRRKTLVKDSIMNGLIQSRLSQVDAQMQGFVLEGFPRTEGQAVSLKDVYLQPTLIAILDENNSTLPEVTKHLNEKYQNVILKIPTGNTDEQAFEKICFHLENN